MIIDHFLTANTLFVLTAVFLGCFVKGALGFGLPLIATPIMMFVLPLPEIVAILVLPIAIANLYQILAEPCALANLTKILAANCSINLNYAFRSANNGVLGW